MNTRAVGLTLISLSLPFTVAGCGGGSGSNGTNSGLVAYWPANDNYNDVAGGNNGTPYGGVSFVPGEQGEAFAFDGSTGRIAIPDSASLALTKSLAITAWVKMTANPPLAAYIFFRGDDRLALDPYKLFVNPNGTVGLSISDANGNEVQALSTTPLPLNTWTYVSASLDDSTGLMSVYVNGQKYASTTTTIRPFGPLDQSENPGEGIGNVQSGNYFAYFNGDIDELKVYNTAAAAALPPSP